MSHQQTWTNSVGLLSVLRSILIDVVDMHAYNIIVGGPDRPPSKRMIEQMRAEEHAQRMAARNDTASSSSRAPPGGQEEGYWAYMQRQVQERTENLGLAGDSMDKLEDNSQGFANDINKFVKDQKKAAVKGCKSYSLQQPLRSEYLPC